MNEQVKRNKKKIPGRFHVSANSRRKNRSDRKMRPPQGSKIFTKSSICTEHGAVMLASILNSETAIEVNIQVVRVFTKMREMILTHKDILLQLEKIEKKLTHHDEDIALIFQYLKQLLSPPQPPRRKIGFRKDEDN